LAKWNQKVAHLSLRKGSFLEAIKFLRMAISYLPEEEMWTSKEYYDLTLQLHNRLMEIEFAQGDHSGTTDMIAVVLSHAGSHEDKVTAYYTQVQLAVESNDRNSAFGVTKSLHILSSAFNVQLPPNPSNLEICLEKAHFQMTLQNRPISFIGGLDLVKHKDEIDVIMRLLSQLSFLCAPAKNYALIELVTFRAMRLTFERGLSKYLPVILATYSVRELTCLFVVSV